MSWRETLKRVAAIPPVRRGVRAVTASQFLPIRFRSAVFRKVAVRIPINGDFESGGIRFGYAGSARLVYWLDCYEPTTLDLFLRYAETARTPRRRRS